MISKYPVGYVVLCSGCNYVLVLTGCCESEDAYSLLPEVRACEGGVWLATNLHVVADGAPLVVLARSSIDASCGWRGPDGIAAVDHNVAVNPSADNYTVEDSDEVVASVSVVGSDAESFDMLRPSGSVGSACVGCSDEVSADCVAWCASIYKAECGSSDVGPDFDASGEAMSDSDSLCNCDSVWCSVEELTASSVNLGGSLAVFGVRAVAAGFIVDPVCVYSGRHVPLNYVSFGPVGDGDCAGSVALIACEVSVESSDAWYVSGAFPELSCFECLSSSCLYEAVDFGFLGTVDVVVSVVDVDAVAARAGDSVGTPGGGMLGEGRDAELSVSFGC